MTETDRFNKIIEDDLCIGCGLCQSLLGPAKIKVETAPDGELRPRVAAPLSTDDVDLVYATCPGVRCEGLPPETAADAPHHDLVWGPYHSLTLGWAAEPGVRFEGSTGGVLTALGRYLLAAEKVAFILQVRADPSAPTFGVATVSTTVDEVRAASGSRYGPAAPLIDLETALARGEPFAVIAKPCDLNALRNLAHHDPRVDQLIRYRLAPVCGGFMPDISLTRFLADRGIERDAVTGLRYRGFGCPGPTTVETSDGQTRSFDYLDVWDEDDSGWSLPFRCKICPDGIGEAADVAAADTWPGGAPTPEQAARDPGTNSLIARTARGHALVNAATAAGYLAHGGIVDTAYLSATQPHQERKKRVARARYDGLEAAGRLYPETIGLRLDALHGENDPATNAREADGAYQRATRPKG